MRKIGLDFGTTNSTISFYNQETKTLDCFQMSAGSTEYIPTVIAYKGAEISIGDVAKKNMTKKGYEAYEHFKLRLGQDAHQTIPGKSKSPLDVTTDYIRTILEVGIRLLRTTSLT